jgi:hypothetical protein
MRFLEMFPSPYDHDQIKEELSSFVEEFDDTVDLREWLLGEWIVDTDDSVLALFGTSREDPNLLIDAAGWSVTVSSESRLTFTDPHRESPDEYSMHYWVSVESPDKDLASGEGTDDDGHEAIESCVGILINDLVRRCRERS